MTQNEAILEIHDRVRQCFTRHQFKTFGDALQWLHSEDFANVEMEAGEQGCSKFSTDILWLISQFGPKTQVDHKVIDTRKVSALKPSKIKPDTKITTPPKKPISSKSKPKSKKRKPRRF